VAVYAGEWQRFVEELFFYGEESGKTREELLKAYRESFPESTYQKGVVGGLKEAGWQASHGPGNAGLTFHVLGDITWAFWKMLVASVRYTLDREPVAEEMNRLAEKVCGCMEYLVELWFCTLKNSELGSSREGELPKRWAIEDEEAKKKIEAIKRAGVSARYEYKPVVVLDSERKQLTELKKFLETRLIFHSIEPSIRTPRAELK